MDVFVECGLEKVMYEKDSFWLISFICRSNLCFDII